MKFLPFKWFPLVWLIMVSPCQAAEQNHWINLYVGQTQQRIVNIGPAADGGVIAVGVEPAFDYSVGPFLNPVGTAWAARLDGQGNVLWHNRFGPAEVTVTLDAVLATQDGDYLVAGQHGGAAWLARLGADGALKWQYAYDFPDREPLSTNRLRPFTVLELAANLYAVGVAYTQGNQQGFLLLQLRGDGTALKQIHYQVPGFSLSPAFLQATGDGGFVVSGRLWPEATDPTLGDAWVLKLDRSGEMAWTLKLGDPRWNEGVKVRETPGGGYVGIGSSSNFASRELPWLVGISTAGEVQWQKTYGYAEQGRYFDIQPLADGGYLLAGGPWDGTGSDRSETWLLELDGAGDVRRRRVLALPGTALQLERTGDGDMFISGFDADAFRQGGGFWLAKTGGDGSAPDCFVKGTEESSADVVVRRATLEMETLSVETSQEPLVTKTATDLTPTASSLVTLPLCPASRAYRSCSQIKAAAQSYGSGRYPVLLPLPGKEEPEILQVRCEMDAYGGGWMLIASHFGLDPWPPSRFVSEHFGDYPATKSFGAFPAATPVHDHSFSIWPAIDWDTTTGDIGISWWDKDSRNQTHQKSALLQDLGTEKLLRLLETSPWVDVWVR